jgi:hypothetical protein
LGPHDAVVLLDDLERHRVVLAADDVFRRIGDALVARHASRDRSGRREQLTVGAASRA